MLKNHLYRMIPIKKQRTAFTSNEMSVNSDRIKAARKRVALVTSNRNTLWGKE